MPRPIESGNDDRRRLANNDCLWFMAIEKHNVLNEMRSFDDRYFDKTRLLSIIKKLLYLLNQGETFTKSEAASIISSVINQYLFQDAYFRRMFHLIARELCPVAEEDTSYLLRVILLEEINNYSDVSCRAHAIRLLFLIPNVASLSEVVVKCLEEALWSQTKPLARSAAVVCAINLLKRDPCWANTLAPMRVHTNPYIRFQTLYLVFQINRHDLVLLNKCCGHITYSVNYEGLSCWSTSPWEPCILARAIAQMARHMAVSVRTGYYKFLHSCIDSKDELIAIEGFRSLAAVRGITSAQLKPAIDVVRQIFRVSNKPVMRFGAFRALQKVGVVWITPEDHIAISLDVNVNKLYLDQVMHRDKEEDGAENVSQIITTSQSFTIKEASTQILKKRLK